VIERDEGRIEILARPRSDGLCTVELVDGVSLLVREALSCCGFDMSV
jgi:hypothetical protein